MKKYVWITSILLIFICIITMVFIFRTYTKGNTSGTVSLFVDGKEIRIDDTLVEFSYTLYTNGQEKIISKNSKIKNGRFNFNESAYSIYWIKFSLEPNLWGDTGDTIQFEIKYFCTFNRAVTDFDIQINVVSEEVKIIELVANGTNSDKIPIDSSGMTIFVFIPSP